MLTMFAVPKAFRGHIEVIQNNAIESWRLIHPELEIILFGNEEGIAEAAIKFGIRHIPDIECNEHGTPLVSSVFSIAQNMARNQLMCYVNADIILTGDFLPSVQSVHKYPFLVIGRRWDIEVKDPIDFSQENWERQLRTSLAKEGKLHAPTGLDYFVFPKGLYNDVPPFALGRTAWDNWLVYRIRSQKIPVIDATKAITAIHQNHDYAHHPEGKTGAFKGVEALQNQELLGGGEYSLNTMHATWLLTPGGLKRALTLKHLYYQLNKIPVLFPRLHFLEKPRRILIALIVAIRSILGKTRR